MSLAPTAAQRWLRPAALGAFTMLVGAAGTLLGPPQHAFARPIDALAAGLVLVSGATAAFGRRWPVPSFAVALATAAGYFAAGYHTDGSWFVGLMVTAYVSGGAGQRWRSAAFGAAAVAALGAAARFGLSRSPADFFFTAVIVLGALLAGQVSAELRAASEARDRKAREEATRHALVEERVRIARELHDVVAHSIATVNVQASSALHVWAERPEQAREALVNIKGASRDALRDLRSILGLLRDPELSEPLAPSGGVAGLPGLVANVRLSGHDVRLSVDDGLQLPAGFDLAVYRVVQEALTNVVRHAPGAAAEICVARRGQAIEVRVENERPPAAPGPESRQGAGHGLAGMRERVEAFGGRVESGATASGGFRVEARMPLPERAS